VLTATVLTIGLWPFVGGSVDMKQESVVSAKGALQVPADYRTRYESLGSWSIAGDGRAGAWGDGWAWSWFDADKPQATTSTDYTKDCKACHVPAQKTDWIYVQGYPALK
jgi:hypothetical protein